MSTKLQIELPTEQLAEFCRRNRIRELAVFGSILREDFGPDSDVDFLVQFEPDAKWSLFDVVRIEGELSELVGRPVDLVERRAVEQSDNYIRRKSVLSTAETIYGA